ncbi:hypothetical protein D3260_13945 [Salinisphaera sp. Q1T1-3]|nr:hypothetical protein D3260_13945 [Salinisphaera sp. Q1T1-3]
MRRTCMPDALPADSAILWFKNDLRLDDNPALTAAATATSLLCVYCLDARFAATTVWDIPKIGAHRHAFIGTALPRFGPRSRPVAAISSCTAASRKQCCRNSWPPPAPARSGPCKRSPLEPVEVSCESAPSAVLRQGEA